jgi:hypothetical protein
MCGSRQRSRKLNAEFGDDLELAAGEQPAAIDFGQLVLVEPADMARLAVLLLLATSGFAAAAEVRGPCGVSLTRYRRY